MISTRVTAAVFVTLVFQGAMEGRQAPSFHTETRLVVLYATVKNDHGELVTNLDQTAFNAFENGKRQPITLFRRDDVPEKSWW